MSKVLFFFIGIFISHCLYSQSPFPDTEIYVAEIMLSAKGISFTTPVNITNREGYDNQPCFTPDGKSILFSSIREDGQADIYRYEILTKKESRVTSTPESEYSPTLMPGKKYFSVVRVEKDSTQRIWKFPLNGGDPELLFSGIDSIGYHCWLGQDSVALFILTEPFTLQLASANNTPFTLTNRIGRCLKMIPEENALSYVTKQDSLHWMIQKYSLPYLKISTLCATLPQSEDFAWMSDGSILMGQGGKIFQTKPSLKEWKQVADFSSDIDKIGRISISPDGKKIAIVALKKK